MATRKENAQKTREKLLKAAELLLSEKGFGALSVDEITRQAGVAKGTFYVYFSHKEDVVTEICRGYFSSIADQVSGMRDVSMAARLRLYMREFMAAVEKYGIHICREWIRSTVDPEHPGENVDNSKWAFDVEMLRGIIRDGMTRGELRKDTPADLLAYLLISQLYGMMLSWCMSDGVFEPLEWSDRFSDAELEAILKPYLTAS